MEPFFFRRSSFLAGLKSIEPFITMAAMGPFSKSSLAAESPPFNPRHIGLLGGPNGNGNGNSGNQSHHHQLQQLQQQQQQHHRTNSHNNLTPPHSRTSSRSRSSSPFLMNSLPATTTASASANSNAVATYTFQYQGQTLEIRNVWAENVEEEMAIIRQLIEKYPYVAMDTEFPGVVAKPVTETYSPDYHYKSLKVNVDLLKIIQLGLSFADEHGNFAPGCPCWQFNFQFDLEGDMFAQDSIDLLQKSGISFEDHAKRGIDPILFGELLMVSGLVLDDRVKWVSFHSGCTFC